MAEINIDKNFNLNLNEPIQNGNLIKTVENIDVVCDSINQDNRNSVICKSPPKTAIQESEDMDVNSDIYASEMLQVTDSEDEGMDKMNAKGQKKISPLRKRKIGQIIERDSDQEQTEKIGLNDKERSIETSVNSVKKPSKTKYSSTMDSDSEEENSESPTRNDNTKVSKISTLIDTDTDKKTTEQLEPSKNDHRNDFKPAKTKIDQTIESDSDEEQTEKIGLNDKELSIETSVNSVKKPSKTKVSSIVDTDSEEENCESSIQNDITKVSKISTLIDTDTDKKTTEQLEPSKNDHRNDFKPAKTKIDQTIESDSDEEQTEKIGLNDKELSIETSVNSVKKPSKTKVSSIVDTDSEEENFESSIQNDITKVSKISTLIDTDTDKKTTEQLEPSKNDHRNDFKPAKTKIDQTTESDSDEEQTEKIGLNDKELSIETSVNYVKKPSNTKYSSIMDSDSEEDNSESPTRNDIIKVSKISTLIDSDTDNEITEQLEPSQNEHRNDSKPAKRASAKQALKEIMAIKSETQRLTRENNVSVPYHIPKHHTLKEFMKRRTIAQPQYIKEGKTNNIPRLKMNQEELEKYAKHLEERAKEASDFFKSESETEDNNEIENIEETLETFQTPNNEIVTENLSVLNSLTENSIQAEKQSLQKEKIKKLLDNLQLSQSPSIKGNPKMFIDFETGNFISPKPSPVDNLKERFFKNFIQKKPKTDNTIQILSTENGQMEITKINVVAEKETKEVNKHKPGAAFFKLKESLRTIINKKRKEEFVKKLEDEKEKENEIMKCGFNDEDDEDDESLEEQEMLWKKKNIEMNDKEEYEENNIEDRAVELDDNEDFDNENEGDDEDENEEASNEEDEEDFKIGDKVNAGINSENDDNESNDKSDNESDDEDDEESDDEKNKNKKPKNRIIRPFLDSDGEEDNIYGLEKSDSKIANLHQKPNYSSILSQHNCNNPISQIPMTQYPNQIDEDELIGLCSGKFAMSQNNIPFSQIPMTQSPNQTDEDELFGQGSSKFKDSPNNNPKCQISMAQLSNEIGEDELMGTTSEKYNGSENENVISQIPMTQTYNQTDEDELIGLCSGEFKDVPNHNPISQMTDPFKQIGNFKGRNKIFSSDEDCDKESDETSRTSPPKSKKLKKKKRNKLEDLTDDEDDIDVPSKNQPSKNEKIYVEYDSEENEIELPLAKEDLRQKANPFFENEAELSESEWGSADEDEKGLDQYEVELGDEDEFDKTKIRHELEQIHMRKMLDDDKREVKKIQEMLFEDEENDGIGRQRQFRWKNNENGFSLDDPSFENEPPTNLNDSKDEEMDEQTWRKMRHERELILNDTSKQLHNESSSTFISSSTSAELNNLPPSKKLNIITNNMNTLGAVKNNSTFLISKAINKQSTRGSFLVRDAEILSKLATLTKSNADSEETAGTVKLKTLKAKNFVFATLTEKEHNAAQNFKRKTDQSIGSTLKSSKKQKLSETTCLIDQLL